MEPQKISPELLKKIRRIEILSKKAAQHLFAGEYHSAFKGRGMEFSEVREYQSGDDVRFIDWNVSSRMGKLFSKQYIEERELTILLAVDLSSSLHFFSGSRSKKDTATELAAVIAFTAMLNNDKVGLLIFSDRIELYLPPKKGKTHLLRLIREMLNFSPEGHQTSLEKGLAYLNQVLKKRSIIFLISDFLDRNYSQALKISSKKHDLIAVDIFDERERSLPSEGVFWLRDCEGRGDFYVDFGNPETRKQFRIKAEMDLQEKNRLFRQANIDCLRIRSGDDYERTLVDFFLRRRRKLRR